MKILIDMADTNSNDDVGKLKFVDSSRISILDTDSIEDDSAHIRAEWLYHVMVDSGINIAIVDDVSVASVLESFNIEVIRLV